MALTFFELVTEEIENILSAGLVNPIDATEPFFFFRGSSSEISTPARTKSPLIEIIAEGNTPSDNATEKVMQEYTVRISVLVRDTKKVDFNKNKPSVAIKADFFVIYIIQQIWKLLRKAPLLNDIVFETEKLQKHTISNADYISEDINNALYSTGTFVLTVITTQIKPENR